MAYLLSRSILTRKMKSTYDRLSKYCSKATTKLYSTSFSLGILFLNKDVRQPVYDIYGFVMLADEIVDSFHDFNKAELLAEFRRDCFLAIERGISLNPILNAFQDVVNRFGVEKLLIEQFLDSMKMDLSEQLYTAEKYEKYILGSAQVVGLMCLRVFTCGNNEDYDRLKVSAMKMGSAFQKVNFLRDLNADFQLLNRSYFPNVAISAFDDVSKKLIEKDIEGEFKEALKGINLLTKSCSLGVYLAYLYYQRLFKRITTIPAESILNERVRISNVKKFVLMFKAMLKVKFNFI